MVIPIGDENPRSTTPVVTWTAAALCALGYAGSSMAEGAPAGGLGFLVSPFVATDPLSLAWVILALLIFGDNVEERLGRIPCGAFLIVAGWVGTTARAFGPPVEPMARTGRLLLSAPHAGAAATAVAVAIAYAVIFPLHQIRFFHVFTRRRSLLGQLFDEPARNNEFHVSAPIGFLLWGLGILGGAMLGPRTAADIGALLAGAVVGVVAAAGARFFAAASGGVAELEPVPPAVPMRRSAAEVQVQKWVLSPKPLRAPDPFSVSGWAVLRESEELFDVGRLGRVVARFTGEIVADATRRIRHTRGVLARGMDRAKAEGLAAALRGEGLASFALDEAATGGLPEPRFAGRCACGGDHVEFELQGGEKVAVAWTDVAVISGAHFNESDDQIEIADDNPWNLRQATAAVTRTRITQTTVIDVVTARPFGRFRIARQEATTPGAGDLSSSGFRELACALLERRGAAPVNRGLSVIAGRGSWGYLAFTAQGAYEEYLWWLLQVIRRRAVAPPSMAAPTAAPQVSWLE
jgi:membrane associated rhomboid family serine protease